MKKYTCLTILLFQLCVIVTNSSSQIQKSITLQPITNLELSQRALTTPLSKIEAHLQLIERSYYSNSTEVLVNIYRKAVKENPTSSPAHILLGRSLHYSFFLIGHKLAKFTGDTSRFYYNACTEFASAFNLDKNSPDAMREYGLSLAYAKADTKIPVELLTKALHLQPNNPRSYVDLAMVIGDRLSKHDEAITLYKKAISLDPTNARAYWYLASEFSAKHDYRSEKDTLIKFLELGPPKLRERSTVRETLDYTNKQINTPN